MDHTDHTGRPRSLHGASNSQQPHSTPYLPIQDPHCNGNGADSAASSASGSHHHRLNRGGSQDPGYRSSGSRSTSYGYPPQENGHNGDVEKYRYADYKPVPPPKTAVYKPVPPPKPKSFPRTQSQPATSAKTQHINNEGNYMNSGNNYSHYNGNSNYRASNNYHDDGDSNGGFDSGQGSSLDREYNDHRYANPPQQQQVNNNSRGQYYYNLPQRQQQQQQHSSPRKSGDGLDLSNREYRGSAFELYKKPVQLQQQPQSYHGIQSQQPL